MKAKSKKIKTKSKLHWIRDHAVMTNHRDHAENKMHEKHTALLWAVSVGLLGWILAVAFFIKLLIGNYCLS